MWKVGCVSSHYTFTASIPMVVVVVVVVVAVVAIVELVGWRVTVVAFVCFRGEQHMRLRPAQKYCH